MHPLTTTKFKPRKMAITLFLISLSFSAAFASIEEHGNDCTNGGTLCNGSAFLPEFYKLETHVVVAGHDHGFGFLVISGVFVLGCLWYKKANLSRTLKKLSPLPSASLVSSIYTSPISTSLLNAASVALKRAGIWLVLVCLATFMAIIEGAVPSSSDSDRPMCIPGAFPEDESSGEVVVAIEDEASLEDGTDEEDLSVEVARDAEVGERSLSFSFGAAVSLEDKSDVDADVVGAHAAVVVDKACQEEDLGEEDLTVELARDAEVSESSLLSVFIVVSKDGVVVEEGSFEEEVGEEDLTVEAARDAAVGECSLTFSAFGGDVVPEDEVYFEQGSFRWVEDEFVASSPTSHNISIPLSAPTSPLDTAEASFTSIKAGTLIFGHKSFDEWTYNHEEREDESVEWQEGVAETDADILRHMNRTILIDGSPLYRGLAQPADWSYSTPPHYPKFNPNLSTHEGEFSVDGTAMDLVDDEDDIHDARLEGLFSPSARDLILPAVAFDSDDDDKYESDGEDKYEVDDEQGQPSGSHCEMMASLSNPFHLQVDNDATSGDINAGAEDKNDEVAVEEPTNEPVVSQARRGLDDIRERLRKTQERLAARRVGLSQYFDKEAREMAGKSEESGARGASEESGDSEEMHDRDARPTESVTAHATPSLVPVLPFNPFDRILANNRAEQQKLAELIVAIKACSPMRPPAMAKWSPPTHDDSVFSSPCSSDSGSESPSSTGAEGTGSVWEESETSISSRSTPRGPRASTWDRPDISPLRYGPRLSRTPTFYDNDNCNNEDGDDAGDDQAVLMCSITYREESADDHILSPVPRPSFGLWDLEPVNPRLEVESESESESEFDVTLHQMPTRIPVWAGLGRRTPGQKVVMSAAEMERRMRVVPEIIAKRKAQEAKDAQKAQDEAQVQVQAQAQATSPTPTRNASPPVAGPSTVRPCARHGRVQQKASTPASQPVAGPSTVRARTARQPVSAPAAPAATKPDRKGKGKAPVRAAKPAWRF